MKEAAFTGYLTEDTIAAEASPPGRGGVSVIRLSGSDANLIARRLFSPELPPPGQFRFGRIHALDNPRELIDQAVALVFAKPHSYTGEDVVEFNAHGSPVVVEQTLEELYRAGARPAASGEFTCRAFLNGRIDLTQAEAVADLIAAGSRQSAEQALRQLSGGLKHNADQAAAMVERLLTILELELDFADDDLESQPLEAKLGLLTEAERCAANMLRGYREARNLRTGIDLVIAGAPNVGKSSLLNALTESDRAIVHSQPGTTRDVVEASAVLGGIEFRVKDTAGLRKSFGEVEDEGLRRAKEAARQADVIIQMRSVDHPEIINYLDNNSVTIIKVINKTDLGKSDLSDKEIPISIKTGRGMLLLKERLTCLAAGLECPGSGVGNRERHFKAATAALAALSEARRGLTAGFSPEIAADSLRTALAELDSLTGKNRLDGLLEEIFSKFCIGK